MLKNPENYTKSNINIQIQDHLLIVSKKTRSLKILLFIQLYLRTQDTNRIHNMILKYKFYIKLYNLEVLKI